MLWEFGDGTTSTELNQYIPLSIRRLCGNANSNLSFWLHLCPKSPLSLKRIFIGVPNAFSNNDNINDTLRPVTKALKNVRLDIYDTWGSLIYSGKFYEDGMVK
jgi:hypothetical protein